MSAQDHAEVEVTNEIVSPAVPCDECMKFFTSGTDSSDFVAVYCCHRFCLGFYSPHAQRWEIRVPIRPGKLKSWIEHNRNRSAPALWGEDKKNRREAKSMAIALGRLEASVSGLSGAN